MQVTTKMIGAGAGKGLQTTLELAKILIPTAIIITVLQESGGVDYLARQLAPWMKYFGLSGEASLVLFSGYLVNIYAAIGAMVALELGLTEITTLAVMLCFAHSLIIESAISKKAGAPISYILPLRLGCSLLFGLLMGGIS